MATRPPVAVRGTVRATNLGELRAELASLHPKHDVFPAEFLLELAADAIEESGASRHAPIEFAHTRAQHYKSLYTLRAAAMIRADLDPGLLDEISHWRNDDLWTWSLDALLVYLRVAAERTDRHSRPSANGSRPATRSPSNADPVRASG